MLKKHLYIGADHRGYHLKNVLLRELRSMGYEITDLSDASPNPDDDYPVFASRVSRAVLESNGNSFGILLCGSGQGMAMTANRFKGIRAAVAWDKNQARLARNDDDSNVIALPADIFEKEIEEAVKIIEVWVDTPFESIPRRARRIREMDQLS